MTNSPEFVLYAYNFPSRAERVIWVLNELGLDYDLIRLNPLEGETLAPEFLKMNPARKVPVLLHEGRIYTESVAILVYLCSLHPEANLLPAGRDGGDLGPGSLTEADVEGEGNYRVWHAISYGLSEVEPYLWIADQCTRLKMLYHWPKSTLEESLDRVKTAIQHLYAIVEENEFVAGKQFSIADIYIHHILGWSRGYQFKPPAPALAYMKRLAQRPGYPSSLKKPQEDV